MPNALDRLGPHLLAVFVFSAAGSAAALAWQEQDPLNAGFSTPEIPWTSSVIHRAKELENGNWGAAAAGAAVTRATIAVISGALSASTAANAADSN